MMRTVLTWVAVACVLAACGTKPTPAAPDGSAARARAQEAQSELSSEVGRSGR